MAANAPKPDYLSRDFNGLKASLQTYASQTFPEWQPASEGDLGMVMLELFAYTGDIISYYTDRAQFENYLPTATQRDSVLGLAYLLGYVPNSGTPATGTVTLVTDSTIPDTTIPAGTQISTSRIEALDGPVVFEVNDDTIIPGQGAAPTPVNVTEGTTENYIKVGEATGLPALTALLPHTGVYRGTIRIFIEDSLGATTFAYGNSTITAREWTQVTHLLDAEATDTVFEAQFLDNSTLINFGDDINGAIPNTGLQIFATYRHGAGSLGNVPAGSVRLINDRALAGVHVSRDSTSNAWISSDMVGGTDPETTESIRRNAPRAYRTQNRSVNKKDFKDVALGVDGVTRANVVSQTFTSVTVYVTGPDGGIPSQTLKDLVQKEFTNKTLVGVDVTVASPTLIPVNIGASGSKIAVEMYPQYSNKTGRAAVLAAIRTYIPTLRFGEKLTVGKLYDVISNVEGVRYVDIPLMARNDSVQSGTAAIMPRDWEVLTVGTMSIDVTGGVA